MNNTLALKALSNQRRAVVLAVVLAVGGFWMCAVFGKWQIGVFVVVGIALGLVNHVLTELSLLRAVESEELLTRKQFGASSLVRLLGVSVVGIAVAVIFWPDGATVLIGLAIFHLIALVATGVPLLKELRKI